jgi:hypothetical protein
MGAGERDARGDVTPAAVVRRTISTRSAIVSCWLVALVILDEARPARLRHRLA